MGRRGTKRKMKGGDLGDDIRAAFDPNKIKEKFENAFDPNKNGLAESVKHTVDAFKTVDWKDVNSKIGDALDPQKNGVAAAFDRFGGDTRKAFEDLGQKIRDQAMKDKAALDTAFAPFVNEFSNPNSALSKFVASTGIPMTPDQWKKKFEDPDTYFTILSLMVTAAASVVSAGMAGPATFAAMQALIATAKVITHAAMGQPPTPMDILGVVTAAIPGKAAVDPTSWMQVAGTVGTVVAKNAVKAAAKNAISSNVQDRMAQMGETLATISMSHEQDTNPTQPFVDLPRQQRDQAAQAKAAEQAAYDATPEGKAQIERARAAAEAAQKKKVEDQYAQQEANKARILAEDKAIADKKKEMDYQGSYQQSMDKALAAQNKTPEEIAAAGAAAVAARHAATTATSTKTPLYFKDPAGGTYPDVASYGAFKGKPKVKGIAETVADYNARTNSTGGWDVAKFGPFDPDAYRIGKQNNYEIYDPDFVAAPSAPDPPPVTGEEEMEGGGYGSNSDSGGEGEAMFGGAKYSAVQHMIARMAARNQRPRLQKLDPAYFAGGLRGSGFRDTLNSATSRHGKLRKTYLPAAATAARVATYFQPQLAPVAAGLHALNTASSFADMAGYGKPGEPVVEQPVRGRGNY